MFNGFYDILKIHNYHFATLTVYRVLKKTQLKILNEKETAIHFFVVNKCSFSGLTESSSFSTGASDGNFTFKNIDNLLYYAEIIQKWKITNYDYIHLLKRTNEKILIYLDPPYNINNYLYGKKGALHKKFDHDLFVKKASNLKCNSIISYNNDPVFKEKMMESGLYHADLYDLTYTLRSVGEYMKNQSNRKELLLNNFC